MPRLAWTRWLASVMPVILAGCADNALVLQGQVQKLQQQETALARQNQMSQERAAALDRDNQELQTLLAQSRQRAKVLDDQVAAMRDQMGSVTSQLAQIREEKQSTETKVQTLQASMHRQGGVTIPANNSLLQNMPAFSDPGISVRRDGDVIRIELPGSRLFDQASAHLRPGANRLILDVIGEVLRTYPDQMLGVEGHTDSDQIYGGQFHSNHELSVARASAVYDVLTSQGRISPSQLFLVGHGPNHPVVSNATLAGKDRNRRVELVIYPEKAPR
jgi:chemotaxis protein MotB